jgi:transposase
VLQLEEWIQIRELGRKGVSVSEIARRTGRDPKTVRKALRQESPQPRPPTWKGDGGKLAPYRDYLAQRVEQGCLNAVVLLEEVVARGYAGKVSILRDFLRPLRRELVRQREATVRFETGPGEQAQADWGEFGKIWDAGGGRWRKLYGFVFTLGYSRAQYLTFTTSCDLEHFLECHLGAFEALGIPEQVLYDNLKTAILGRRPDGSPVFPGRFLDFALYHGFTPKFCRPYRARTKGKVERGIGYVRANFWVRVAHEVAAGALDLAGLNERAGQWVEGVANARRHGTTEEVVAVRLAEEQPLLGRVAARPRYDTSYQSLRRVGRDGRLSYRGQLYQVPLRHALSTVRVSEGLDGRLTLRSGEGVVLVGLPVTAGAPAGRPARSEPVTEGGLPLLIAGAAPVVEARDLAVYEEVGRASRAS